jgi:hypothetical protein
LKERIETFLSEINIWNKNQGFNIAIDQNHRCQNTFILGDEYLIDAIQIEDTKYTKTSITNKPDQINEQIIWFDGLFTQLQKLNESHRKFLHINELKDFIELILEKRYDNFINSQDSDK